MNRVQRYILKEIFPIFVMGNFFFIFLLLLERLITLADLFLAKNVPFILIAETVVYLLPSLLVMTIPLSCLLGVLIAFSRLSADSELIAMRSVGASNAALLRPVIFFGIISAAAGIAMSTYLAEKGSSMAINNLNSLIDKISIKDLREKEMYTDIPSMQIYVDKKINDSSFEGVIFINSNEKTIITAQKGYISPTDNKSIEMLFNNGYITMTDKKGSPTSIGFDAMSLNMPLALDIAKAVESPMTMSMRSIYETMGTNPKSAFEFSKRFALPLSAVLMCLFGFSLGIFSARSGKTFGIIIAIGVAFAFNFLLIFLENTVHKSFIPPLVAPWLPDILLATALVFFLRRVFR